MSKTPTVLLGKYNPKSSNQRLLRWDYYALYPGNPVPDTASLRTLVTAAFKSGYDVEIVDKSRTIMVPTIVGLDNRHHQEQRLLEPLNDYEIRVVLEEANRVPPEPKPLLGIK